MSQRRRSARAGFTLMEVVVTVGMTVTVFAMIGGILISVIDTSEKIEKKLRTEKLGYGVLTTLRRDLTGVYAYALGGLAFKGEDKTEGGKDADGLRFVTTANVLPTQEGIPPPLVEVGYRFGRSDPGPGITMYRRCTALEGDPLTGGEYTEIASGIESMSVEFLDGATKEWKKSWEAEDQLPLAVKVKLELSVTEEERRAAEQSEVELALPIFEMTVGIPAKIKPPDPPPATDAPPAPPG
jgi:type II secretion system protein J